MQFTAKEDFRHGLHLFEAGNTYNSDKYGDVSDDDVKVWHGAGWCEVEGFEAAPERKPGAHRIQPADSKSTVE